MDDAVRVLSAGSLRHAMPEIADAFRQATGLAVSLSLGPAGLLRERIEAGEPFDLFASANMAHPRRLAGLGLAEEAVRFAGNRLCVLARAGLGLTFGNLMDVLSDPSVRIATSTPGDDPAGDYALAMFDRIEARHPGLGEALTARALQLVGGRDSPPGRSAAGLIADGAADLFLGYASNARALAGDPAFTVVEVPPEFAPNIEYGLALRRDAPAGARRFRDFLLSARAKTILEDKGFRGKRDDPTGSRGRRRP